jgi:hypothetical protein
MEKEFSSQKKYRSFPPKKGAKNNVTTTPNHKREKPTKALLAN